MIESVFFDYFPGNNKKSKHQTKSQQQDEAATAEGTPDQPDLDLSSIQFSDAEMRALSGLTPALARRLRRQLLAHLPLLPPRAARDLRRTLSLHAPASAPDPPAPAPPSTPATAPATPADAPHTAPVAAEPPATPTEPENRPSARFLASESPPKPDDAGPELPAPQYCTLPRLKRPPAPPRESPPPAAAAPAPSRPRSPSPPRAAGVRGAPERPLLSKYLTPERTVSLDDTYSSDSNSILSEPSYIAAYGAPGAGGAGGAGFRRHSMRLAGDHPRKRISRFLRSDFYENPPDESLYAKHKKEKELETQKILREIREKKNKTTDNSSPKSPTDANDVQQPFRDEAVYSRKCLSPISPIGILTGKERSRSNTPFFPILDNIKETTIDTSLNTSDYKRYDKSIDNNRKSQFDDILNRDSKLSRPKSYPIKNHDTLNEQTENTSESIISIDSENKDKTLPRESKLIRPKSYPTSSPSPEKVFVNRNLKKEESKITSPTENTKNDVEVTFSFTLPKKSLKPGGTETLNKNDTIDVHVSEDASKSTESDSLLVKKYQILNNSELDSSDTKEQKNENGNAVTNGNLLTKTIEKPVSEDLKLSVTNHDSKKEEVKLKSTESEQTEKKGTIKKKIIRKVSSKSKTDAGNQDSADAKSGTEKKKVTKKAKEKTNDDSAKTTTTTKKKSVLQTIGHKLEKFTSTKSSSPEKVTENNTTANNTKKENPKLSRTQREHSVPVSSEPPTESNLIKRAVTLTDVAALDIPNTTPSKTTVSKVLGLFKKFEPKEKNPKPPVEKSHSENLETHTEAINENEVLNLDNADDKPKRPTSLLLNGIGRKKYGKTTSDSVTTLRDEKEDDKKESTAKNIRNTLKLDFSRLPRVKKIVPTNSVIEPQFMNITPNDKDVEKKELCKNGTVLDGNVDNSADNVDTLSRSRSRSRSSYSNSDIKSDNSADAKNLDRNPLSPPDSTTHHPHRNHESTTPEKEDIVDRIRRKSFYTRFNEKKLRRKSNLVGPGATEYDPIARIHAPPDTKFDISPTSPTTYDLSPGYSVASDLSPSTERYRTLLNDMPLNTRSTLKYDNYGLNDKIDIYRSLDRNDFRKYSGAKSYLDYDQPSSYTSHRYSRTKSLLDNSDGEDQSLGSLREPHKYNRTLSMYSPGSYATYRPKRTLNSAIILKESEKEPSPENILERIRQRKKLASGVTRKPESEKDPMASFRSDVPSKGESDSTECSEKVD